MSSRWKGVLGVAALGALAVAAVVIVGIALGGSKGTATRPEYRATVTNARDRVDFALERVTRSTSVDLLIQRLDEASTTVAGAADELDGADVAKGFGDENDELVNTLRDFSRSLVNTSETFSDPTFAGDIGAASSLSFPEWDKVNAILARLRKQGIRVPPLERH
jgi:ABC-type transporter Mla subunit MlaD